MFTKMRRFWNVRAIPSRAALAGLSLVRSMPSKLIRPPVSPCCLLMALNSVVLPAPLGPMRAVMLPSSHVERHLVDGLQTSEGHRGSSRSGAAEPSALPLCLEPGPAAAARSRWSRPRRRATLPRGAAGRAGDGGGRASLAHSAFSERFPLEQPLDPERDGGTDAEDADRQEEQKQDHDDRVGDAAVLLDGGEVVDHPGHDDGPETPPQMVALPPISAMTMGRIGDVEDEGVGLTVPVTKANRPPARPQMTALATKASSFQLAVLMPRVDEAISLVAMARRDRPNRYLSPRWTSSRMTSAGIQTT